MITFRKALITDAGALDELVNSAYRGESSTVGWTTEAHLLGGQRVDKNALVEMMSNGHIELALDENLKIVGCVFLQPQPEGLYLGLLTVNPKLQTKGTGKELLVRAEEFAREHSLGRIFMTVISSRKELIDFYLRRGYRANGEFRPFPIDTAFGIPKVETIELQVLEKIL